MNEAVGLRAKVPMMAASLVLSFLLWAYVQIIQPANVRYLNIPIQKFNDDESLKGFVVGKLKTASIQITGPDDVLSSAMDDINKRGMVAAYVDLSDAHPGVDNYPLHLSLARHDLKYTVTLEDLTTQVEIQRRGTRTVPIDIDPAGQPADKNLAYDGATASPSVVEISGAADAVRQVKSVKVILDLSQISSSESVPETPEVVDDKDQPVDGVSISPQTVRIAVGMAPAPQSETVLVSPVINGQPAVGFTVKNISVMPNQVAVQGPPEVLSKMRTVPTKAIGINGLTASAVYQVPVELPMGAKLYSAKTVKVRVTIEPVGTSSSSSRPITVP